jgi:hypothetical protein
LLKGPKKERKSMFHHDLEHDGLDGEAITKFLYINMFRTLVHTYMFSTLYIHTYIHTCSVLLSTYIHTYITLHKGMLF